MVPLQNLYRDVEEKMKRAIATVTRELTEIRGGRASPAMLDHITVDYYGAPTPIKSLAAITLGNEVNVLVIQPWDAKAVPDIEKAILKAELGINPIIDGKLVRLPIPPLTGERRDELTKVVHRMAEEGRVTVRTLRRDANESVKKLKAEKQISEDDAFKAQDHVQKLTDRYVESINALVKSKEQELHSV
jgi:ribosome recycling factor